MRFLVFSFISALLLGCSGSTVGAAPAGATDGAIIQVVQDTRDRLRAEPGTYQPNVLSVNSAVGLVSGQTLDDLRNATPNNNPTSDPSALERRYQEAKSLALDAQLLATQNKKDEARVVLEQSVALYPTFTALDLLAPLLSEEPSQVASLCAKTLSASPTQDDRFLIIQRCLVLSPPPDDGLTTPSWASPEDISWFNNKLNPPLSVPPPPSPPENKTETPNP